MHSFKADQVAFSKKLMKGERVSDAEVAEVLGPAAVAPFSHVASSLEGRVRKVTNEPVICHSADIAIRALDLGYGDDVVTDALLHDCVEDKSKTFAQMHRNLETIRNKFGHERYLDTLKLTNRYNIIFPNLPKEIRNEDWEFNLSSVDAIATACREFGRTIEAEFPGEFTVVFYELDQLLTSRHELRDDQELHGGGSEYHKYDTGYSLMDYLGLKCYRLFLEELVRDSLERGKRTESGVYETALVVKALDLVDNLRTNEIGNYRSTSRILAKTMMYLDYTFFLHKIIRHSASRTTFVYVYDYLKTQFYAQMLARRHALTHLEDTRFGFLGDYMSGKIEALKQVYLLPGDPGPELERLRQAIRLQNGISDTHSPYRPYEWAPVYTTNHSWQI